MKVWFVVLVFVILLAGCASEPEVKKDSTPGESKKPLVYVSNYPLQYFANRISASLIDVRLPVPSGEDPAFWVPTPEDISELQQADLVLLNGATYESWLKNVSLPTSRLIVTTENFTERFIALEEATTHSHGPDGEHEHTSIAFTTWLDPTIAVEQARVIKDALSSRWTDHKDQFETQFDGLTQELEAIDTEISGIVKRDPNLPLLFSHPVYQYLTHRYGLNGRSVHWEPHEMPSDSMWQDLKTTLKSHPAQWMIWEGEPSSDIKEKLADLGIQSIVFNPCGSAPEKGDFISVMKQNISALKDVFVE